MATEFERDAAECAKVLAVLVERGAPVRGLDGEVGAQAATLAALVSSSAAVSKVAAATGAALVKCTDDEQEAVVGLHDAQQDKLTLAAELQAYQERIKALTAEAKGDGAEIAAVAAAVEALSVEKGDADAAAADGGWGPALKRSFGKVSERSRSVGESPPPLTPPPLSRKSAGPTRSRRRRGWQSCTKKWT